MEEFPSPRRQGSTGLRLGRGFETSLLRNSTDSVAEKTIGGDSIGNDRSARSFSPQPVQAGMRNIRGFPNIKADVTLRSSGSSFLPSFKNFTILLFYHRSLTCQIYYLTKVSLWGGVYFKRFEKRREFKGEYLFICLENWLNSVGLIMGGAINISNPSSAERDEPCFGEIYNRACESLISAKDMHVGRDVFGGVLKRAVRHHSGSVRRNGRRISLIQYGCIVRLLS